MATNVNITEPPDFLKSYYAALAERGMNLGNLGFTPYSQDRVAPWNEQQNAASSMIQNRALSGSGAMDQAGDWYSNMLAGNNKVGDVNASFGPSSIASGGQSRAGMNPYLGMNNPYLNQQIGNAQADVTGQIDSKFNNTAFGGTAHQQTLARELGRVDSNMRMQDYGAQQGLAENAVNRDLSNQQYNIGNQNQLNQYNANLGFQNAGIANSMGQFNAGLQGQNIGRQQSALSFAPTLAANDYADASAMMGLGNQIQGNNQNIADANYQEFLRQQQYPTQQLQWMSQGLSPTSNTFSNQSSTADTSGSTLANMAGGGALGYAAGSYFDNPWIGALGGAAIGGLL